MLQDSVAKFGAAALGKAAEVDGYKLRVGGLELCLTGRAADLLVGGRRAGL